MVTTVGTEDKLDELLKDLISLDFDAAGAYQAAIDRLDNPSLRARLSEFKQDHLRHTRELGMYLSGLGKKVPTEGDMKSLLTTGKVVLGGLMGDKAVLLAMKTNEDDTNTAYERASQFKDAEPNIHDAMLRNLADERRHRDWLVQTLRTL